jgi:hypothetical protein
MFLKGCLTPLSRNPFGKLSPSIINTNGLAMIIKIGQIIDLAI